MPKKKEPDTRPTDCGVCRYHINKTKECRRHHPNPGQDEDFVPALWNFTRDRQRCGVGSTTDEIVRCDDCLHWWQPDGRPINPPFRQGLPREWWEHSGYCTANAPGGTVHESRWTYWKVTSSHPHNGSAGGCGDGMSVSAAATDTDDD